MNSWWLSLKENIQISYSDNKFWFDYFSRKFHSLNHIAWYNCFIINSSASFCCKVRKRRIGIQLHNKPHSKPQVKCQYCCTHVGEPTNYFISHNCPHNSALKKKKKKAHSIGQIIKWGTMCQEKHSCQIYPRPLLWIILENLL